MNYSRCINCGALLEGDICEYCGTNYSNPPSPKLQASIDGTFGTLTIDDKTCEVYIGSIEDHVILGPRLYADGHVIDCERIHKHKFVLIER